jgi:hypothetical protein
VTRGELGRSGALAPWILLGSVAAVVACGGAGHDVVPESKDVVANGPNGATAPRGVEGYDYVARRPLAVVALAEARGIAPETAHAAVDRLADRLDACITDESRNGGHVDGAARVIAQIGPNGDVTTTSVRIDPGENAAQSAVVCLVAPLKLLTFPPADVPTRGIAIEALWGQLQTTTPAGTGEVR